MVWLSFFSTVNFTTMFASKVSPMNLKMQLSLSFILENLTTFFTHKSISRLDEEVIYNIMDALVSLHIQ